MKSGGDLSSYRLEVILSPERLLIQQPMRKSRRWTGMILKNDPESQHLVVRLAGFGAVRTGLFYSEVEAGLDPSFAKKKTTTIGRETARAKVIALSRQLLNQDRSVIGTLVRLQWPEEQGIAMVEEGTHYLMAESDPSGVSVICAGIITDVRDEIVVLKPMDDDWSPEFRIKRDLFLRGLGIDE